MTQLAPAKPANLPTDSTSSARTFVLDVEGMMCAGCVSTVEKKLTGCDGVQSAQVNLITEVATVQCDPTADSDKLAQTLPELLTDAGYPSTLRQSNQRHAESDWVSRAEAAQQNQIQQLTIAATLLALSTVGHLRHISPFSAWLQHVPIIGSVWFHGLLATLTLIFPARPILKDGFEGIRRAAPNMNTLVSLGALSAYLSSLAALLLPSLQWVCFFDEPVMLLSFILLGRTLEQRARFRASQSLRSLITLQPSQARLIPNPQKSADPSDSSVQIPTEQVQVGDWLSVLPGEKIPTDGILKTGTPSINESMVTGESTPVTKQPGDRLTGGTLNLNSPLTLQVTQTGADTTLGQMIALVETAQTRKAPVQSLADQISGKFTYGVLTCAVLTFLFWLLAGTLIWPDISQAAVSHLHHSAAMGDGMGGVMQTQMITAPLSLSTRLLVSLKLAISVIVVACPCALGLATPTAILVGSGKGAEAGLLIRGGDILEAAAKLDVLCFDKTGTLTTGNPQVTDCISLTESVSSDELLQIAASVEKGTRHPLADAIVKAAQDRQLLSLPTTESITVAGQGIQATLQAIPMNDTSDTANASAAEHAETANASSIIRAGNLAWMAQHHLTVSPFVKQQADDLAQAGKTVVFVSQDEQLIGLIATQDALRHDAKETLEKLKAEGLSLYMLSGDRASAARAIASQLNIDLQQVQAPATPEDKVSAIAALQAEDYRVGFIGDGINDAPALAQADVGIALHSGTDVALETADIVLMGDRLTSLITARTLSGATLRKIRQNLIWAFAYNLVCIPLAAGIFLPTWHLSLTPGFAGGLMALSSITVVLNSLLLRRTPLHHTPA